MQLREFVKRDEPDDSADRAVMLQYDESVLRHGPLTDRHIDFANGILSNGSVQGFNTPLLAQTSDGFPAASIDKPVVQIHHFSQHWVTSYRPSNDETVFVFDSMLRYNGGKPVTSPELVKQLSQIYGRNRSHFDVTFPSVTQQKNGGVDCGVFAIAYAVDVCEGLDPGQRLYDYSQLRRHVVSCFRKQQLSPFPGRDTQRPAARVMKVTAIY
jgi:Ulp1 protease family, C-terminal catalytic domain